MAALPQERGPFTDPSVHSSRSACFHRLIVDSVAACFSCGGSSARLPGIVELWKTVRVGAGWIGARGSMLLHLASTLRWSTPMSDDSGKHFSAHSLCDPPRSWARR